MGQRGRPPSPRAATVRWVHIKLGLYPGQDDDLIAFFASAPHRLRAAMVKRALRSGMGATDEVHQMDEDAVLDALDAFVA